VKDMTEIMLRIEAHEKKFGDTTKMRARLGLKDGEVPEEAWRTNHSAGGSICSNGNYVESPPSKPKRKKAS
jgi:hypothetical protein